MGAGPQVLFRAGPQKQPAALDPHWRQSCATSFCFALHELDYGMRALKKKEKLLVRTAAVSPEDALMSSGVLPSVEIAEGRPDAVAKIWLDDCLSVSLPRRSK